MDWQPGQINELVLPVRILFYKRPAAGTKRSGFIPYQNILHLKATLLTAEVEFVNRATFFEAGFKTGKYG